MSENELELNEEQLEEENKGKDFREDESEMSSTEKLATKYGWNPDGKKSAEEYIEFALEKFPKRGEALVIQNKKLESKDNELSEVKSMLNELSSHMEKQKQMAYQQAMKDMEKQRQAALAQGDVRRLDELEQEKQRLQPPPAAVQDFQKRHASWLNDSSYECRQMQKWLLAEDKELAGYNLGPDRHVEEIEKSLKKQFPNYFTPKDEYAKMSAVDSDNESGVSGKKSKKTFTFNDLNDVQKSMAKYLESRGQMKTTEYIKQLAEMGDLK